LLVEDDVLSREIGRALLERCGYRVDCAEDGATAVERANKKCFDIILMDCRLPIMDGYTATRLIRQQEKEGQHTPIIALTAQALESDRARAIEAGMDSYLTKPITPERLSLALGAHMATDGKSTPRA